MVVGLLLLTANILLGIVSMNQSRTAMLNMIQKSMLAISNSAADLLDGDMMGALTEEDIGSPAYNDALEKLRVFQNNANIEYIYAVRQVGEGKYVFTIDADPVDPGAFGEEIVVTGAVVRAGNGVASVDDYTYTDRWGSFYSAFSPIFDSQGKVAGIVGVDFSQDWFEDELFRHSISIGILTIVTVIVGAAVMVLITGKVRAKFQELNRELSTLAKNMDELSEEINSNRGFRESLGSDAKELGPEKAEVSTDEIEALGVKIRSMQHTMERYLDYMHAQAYTDSLTGVKNTNAYMEEIRSLNEQIQAGTADFCAAVFDIDNLKIVNDEHGHACGDKIIRGAAESISQVFGVEHTFRIGGDEFIAIAHGITEPEAIARLRKISEAVRAFNAAPNHPEATLSISMGTTAYRPGEDGSFREVFVRADEAMYTDKGEHHRRMTKLRVM